MKFLISAGPAKTTEARSLRIGKPLVGRGFVPDDVGVFQRVRVSEETFCCPGFVVPDMREARAGHMIAGFHRVAGHARLEHLRAAFRIACRRGAVADREREEPDQGGESPAATYFVIHKASIGTDRYFTDLIT